MLAERRGDESAMWQLLGASTRARDETGTNILDEDVTFGYWDPNRQPETPEAREEYERGRGLHLEEAVELARAAIAAATEG